MIFKMKQISVIIMFATTLLASPIAFAGETTTTLIVPGMSCPSCPYIIKAAISDVDGVKDVTTTFQRRTATVIFDDEVTSVEAILQAIDNVGYSSSVIKIEEGS